MPTVEDDTGSESSTSDQEGCEISDSSRADGNSDEDDTSDKDETERRDQVETTFSESIRRPCGGQHEDGSEKVGCDGEQVGLDDRVVESTNDLGEEVSCDSCGDTVTQGCSVNTHSRAERGLLTDTGEHPESGISHRLEESSSFELGSDSSRSVFEQSKSSDLFLSVAKESSLGRGPRQHHEEKDGESNGECSCS